MHLAFERRCALRSFRSLSESLSESLSLVLEKSAQCDPCRRPPSFQTAAGARWISIDLNRAHAHAGHAHATIAPLMTAYYDNAKLQNNDGTNCLGLWVHGVLHSVPSNTHMDACAKKMNRCRVKAGNRDNPMFSTNCNAHSTMPHDCIASTPFV